jgi:CBS domain-containing protein
MAEAAGGGRGVHARASLFQRPTARTVDCAAPGPRVTFSISGNRHQGETMRVSDGMSETVLTVGPDHTLRSAARLMAKRRVGAAIVMDPEQPGPGILTERDLLDSLGAGQDPDQEKVGDHLSENLTFASPDWSLERAAEAMVKGGFRHLIVVDRGETIGVLSMRDIVRCWTMDGATCDV